MFDKKYQYINHIRENSFLIKIKFENKVQFFTNPMSTSKIVPPTQNK